MDRAGGFPYFFDSFIFACHVLIQYCNPAIIEPLSSDFGVLMRMNRISSFLLIALLAILLLTGGCTSKDSSMVISVTYETLAPVEGGSTITTSKLGTVHLGPPLLKASFEGGEEVVFTELSLPHFEDYFLCLSPQMFLQSEKKSSKSSGMSMEDYLESMSSEFLQSGRSIYLLIDCEGRRVAHRLKISQRDDPTGLFIQYSSPYRTTNPRRSQLEFLKPLEASDESAKEILIWDSDSNQTLHGGALVFQPTLTSSTGIFNRAKESANKRPDRNEAGLSGGQIFSDNWFCKETIAAWKDTSGDWVGERAYLWPSVPGLHIDMGNTEVIDELKADLTSFESFRFFISWKRISFTTKGISSTGVTL